METTLYKCHASERFSVAFSILHAQNQIFQANDVQEPKTVEDLWLKKGIIITAKSI